MDNYRVAGFWSRFWAYILDLICISVLSTLAVSIIVVVFKVPQQYLGWLKISAFAIGVVGFAYFTIMTRYWGQTIGKMICGIIVVRDDGKDLDWTTAFVREVAGRTISQFFGSYLGYLIIPFIKNNRSCHDLLCDTYVVNVDEFERKKWVNINTKAENDIIDEFEIGNTEETGGINEFEKYTKSQTDTDVELEKHTDDK